MQTEITRKFEFDAGHRVMHQTSKCRNLHGHRYVVELTGIAHDHKAIGYPIDFSELKRLYGSFIDNNLDHGLLVNPADTSLISYASTESNKVWQIAVGNTPERDSFRNPTVENIALDLMVIALLMFKGCGNYVPYRVKVYETPNCYAVVYSGDPAITRFLNKKPVEFSILERQVIEHVTKLGGFLEYDSREVR